MIKKTILFLFCIFLFSTAFGRDKGLLAFSAGPAIPLLEYGKMGEPLDMVGNAKTGVVMKMNCSRRISSSLSITIQCHFMANNFDKGYAAPYNYINYSGQVNDIELNHWTTIGFMVGLSGYFPLDENEINSIEPGFAFGISSISHPGTLFPVMPTMYNTDYFYIRGKSSNTTSLQFNLLFKRKIYRRLCVLTDLQYYYAHPEFSSQFAVTTFFSKRAMNQSMNVGSLNVTAGLGYWF